MALGGLQPVVGEEPVVSASGGEAAAAAAAAAEAAAPAAVPDAEALAAAESDDDDNNNELALASNVTALERETTDHVADLEHRVADLEGKIAEEQSGKESPLVAKAEEAEANARDQEARDQAAEQQIDRIVEIQEHNKELHANVSKAFREVEDKTVDAAANVSRQVAEDQAKLADLSETARLAREHYKRSYVADGVAFQSKRLRAAVARLHGFRDQYDKAMKRFQETLETIEVLEASNATFKEIAAQQAVGRGMREQILSLNASIAGATERVRERHAQLAELVARGVPDNSTAASPATREFLSKAKTMDALAKLLSGNVTREVKRMHQLEDAVRSHEANELKSSQKKDAHAQDLLNQAHALKDEIDANRTRSEALEAHAEETLRAARAADASDREEQLKNLQAELKGAKDALAVAYAQLEGERKAREDETAINSAAERAAQEAAEQDESIVRAKAAAIAADKRAGEVDREALGGASAGAADESSDPAASATGAAGLADAVQRARRGKKVRSIVSHLLYAEGDSRAAKEASLQIVDAVNSFHSDEEVADAGASEARHEAVAQKRDTSELHSKIAVLNETISREAARHDAAAKKVAQAARFRSTVGGGLRRQGGDSKKKVARASRAARAPAGPSTSTGDDLEVVPQHCFNGAQDAGEHGVDCGGECPRQCGMVPVEEVGSPTDRSFHSVQMLPRHELWAGQDQSPAIVAKLDCGPGKPCTHPERANPSMPTIFVGESPNERDAGGWREVSSSRADQPPRLRR